jgi:large subunit ribosomal protein L25
VPITDLTLDAQPRTKTGSTASRAIRRSGMVPAVLYGHGQPPAYLAVSVRALEEALHAGGRSGILTVRAGGSTETAIIRDLQRDPVTHHIIHVDLQRVSAHEQIHARLPLVAVGTARGVRDYGGVLDVLVHELEVEGPADRLPDHLEADVTALGIHQHLTAGEIPLPEGFRMLTPPETIVITVEPSKTARVLEETAATQEQAEPEVIGQRREATSE